MSGQLLLADASTPTQRHLRVRVQFSDGDPELRFVDQRTFGGLLADHLEPTPDVERDTVPSSVAHIARDPLDAAFDAGRFARLLRRGRRELKPALLDQQLISGIGNIYADETLWRARLSGRRRADTLRAADVSSVLCHARAVLLEALAAGGTSFDRLYVSAAGNPGWFAQALAVYGRAGRPCPRCGSAISRTPFANRSSFSCPRCQRLPRTASPSPTTASKTT